MGGTGAAAWRTGNSSGDRTSNRLEVARLGEIGTLLTSFLRFRVTTSDQGASILGVEHGGRRQAEEEGSHTTVSLSEVSLLGCSALFIKKLDNMGSRVVKPDSCRSFISSSTERRLTSSLRSAIFLYAFCKRTSSQWTGETPDVAEVKAIICAETEGEETTASQDQKGETERCSGL